jgi:hypothetical protein
MVQYKAKELQFVSLRSAARRYLKQAKDKPRGYCYDCMTAMLYSAFMIEAYVNEIGDHLFKNWKKDHDRKPLKQKVKVIGKILGTKFDFGIPPLCSIHHIMNYRHLAVHAKAQNLTEDVSHEIAMSDQYRGPRSELDQLTTVKNAEEHVTQAEEIIKSINRQMPDKENPHRILRPCDSPFALLGTGGTA